MIDDCKTGARGTLFCQKMGVAAGHFFELQREHAGLDERICRCGVGAALEIFRCDRGDLADEIPEKIFEVFEIVEIKTLHDHLADERRALDQMGRSNLGRNLGLLSAKEEEALEAQKKKCITAVSDAAASLQKSRTGALMVFERQTKLGDIIDTGTVVDAIPSPPIIGNIFFNKAPLHDGAMVIRDGMVYAAGCILPLTKSDNVSIDLGTRHRAAIGMSENSDAVVVVVSEETGQISIACNGVLTRNYTRDTLKAALEGFLLKEEPEHPQRRIPSIRRGKKHE